MLTVVVVENEASKRRVFFIFDEAPFLAGKGPAHLWIAKCMPFGESNDFTAARSMCSLDRLGPKHGQDDLGSQTQFYKILSEQISYCDDSSDENKHGKIVAPKDAAKYVEEFSISFFRHYSSIIEQFSTCKESLMLTMHVQHHGDLFQELSKADFRISLREYDLKEHSLAGTLAGFA
jgi:hypothetical protein